MGNSILDDNYDEDETEYQRKKLAEIKAKEEVEQLNEQFKLPEITEKTK